MAGTINLGDIVWGLGPDTSRLRKALRDILDFGEAVEQAAQSAEDGGAKIESAFRKQEAAIVSSITRMQAFNQQLRNAGAPPQMIKQTQDAFKALNEQMVSGALTPLQYQRAMEQFNTSMSRSTRSFKDWKTEQEAGVGVGGRLTNTLGQMARASQLVTGPLSGISYRLTVLGELISDNTLHWALLVGGIAAAGYAFVKISESTLRAEEGLLRTRMQLTALSGSLTIAQADMKFTLDVANQFGEPFENIASHFAKIETAARGTSLEGSKVRDLFKEIISYSSNMGQTQEQLSGQLNHVTEMLSRQQLQWRDVRGFLTSEYPNAVQIAAAAMNMTVANFERAMRRGDLVAAQFLPKFFAQLNSQSGFDPTKSVDNLFASQGRLSNSFLVLNNALNQTLGLTDSYKSTLDTINRVVLFFAENMETVVRVTTAAGGALLGGLLAPRVFAAFSGLVTVITSVTRALITMDIAAAAAALITNPAGWVALAGAVAGAYGAYTLFDSIVKTNKDNLLGTLPTIDAYIKAYDSQKKTAAENTKAMLGQAQAALIVAQANMAAASTVGPHYSGDQVAPGEIAANSWWEGFKGFFKKLAALSVADPIGDALDTLSKKAADEAAARLTEASNNVRNIQGQINNLNKILDDQRKKEAAAKDKPNAETAIQRSMRLANEEMGRFVSESNTQFNAMKQGPAALQDALEKIQLEKTIEGWRDKLQRAGFTTSEVKDKMVVLAATITKLKDAELFDKKFVSFGQLVSQSVGTIGTGAINKFVDALNSGGLKALKAKDLIVDALGQIEKKILELAVWNPLLNQLFGGNAQTFSLTSGGTGTGGLVGSLLTKIGLQPGLPKAGDPSFIGPVLEQHGGSGTSTYRYADMSMFLGAQRLHTGLAPDEFPAILQQGETVIPKGRSGGMSEGNHITNVYNMSGQPSQTSQRTENGTNITDVIIGTANKAFTDGKATRALSSQYNIQQKQRQR